MAEVTTSENRSTNKMLITLTLARGADENLVTYFMWPYSPPFHARAMTVAN